MEPQAKRSRTEATKTFNYSGENDGTDVPNDVVALHCKIPLERIPERLCKAREYLKEVSFPEGLKAIERNAFDGCVALENVSMPLSLEKIEEFAFDGCTALTGATLSEGIRYIGQGAFSDCSSLSRIKIPSTMETIEEITFSGCSSLEDVDLGEGLKIIREHSFSQCSSLQRIVVSSTVEVIEDGVFWKCEALQEVKLFEGLKKLGKAVFQECFSLCDVCLPSTVESLEERVFDKCISLAKVELKSGLTAIGENCFGKCVSLKAIEVPPTVEILHRGAFHTCVALGEVILQDGLKIIKSLAFGDCRAIQNIEIPSTVETIQENAFSQCSELKDVHIKDGLTEVTDSFSGCRDIENVRLPHTMIAIGQHAFFDKVHLLELSLPIGLKAIKEHGLANCYSLKWLYLPSTVEELAYKAFSGCINMVTVEFPRNMVATIAEGVFDRCISLVNISIPSGMTERENDTALVHSNCFGQRCTQLIKHFGQDNLAKATTHRYDGYPIHEACYHSSTTTVDDLEELLTATGWHEKELKEVLVDKFGMTPFHVLVTADKLRHDLLNYLVYVYPPYVLWWTDGSGNRVTDYLDWHCTAEDSKSPYAEVLYRLMVDRLSDWGRDDWKSEMRAIVEDIICETSPADREDTISEAYTNLEKFEFMASAALLELVLWKRALNAAGAASADTDRPTCRALCGADIIIPNVITFLDDMDGRY